jgi:hypothetical protein
MNGPVSLWLALLLALAGPVAVVRAAAGSDEAAQQAFRTGVDAARQERWSDALAAFEKAYGLSPRPVVLINLASAQVRTGHLVEAAKSYRRILDDPPSAETSAFRRAAAAVLPSLEERTPRVRVRPVGLRPDDVVQIDGQAVDASKLAGAAQALDPGEHTVIVARAGIERARVLFALAERESRDIALPLPGPLLGASPPVTALDAPSFARTGDVTLVDRPATSRSGRRWWASAWTWVAAGVVLAGASVAAVVIYRDRNDDVFSGNVPPGQITVR